MGVTLDQLAARPDIMGLIDAAVAAEREACAKVAEDDTTFALLEEFGMQSHYAQLRTNIARAIRARSEKLPRYSAPQ